ncbi:hypothetical protein EMPS_04364 [Entomortierella parvispora]|uniref:DUF455-domain-containing protein n=1 Tax=Entomortierella parvispora TaxID=205924 RepID=A0A9P3LVG7_9FUNG|nr:hypothetical protein EMPS_04364 [Entomortierella parvispora]
MHVIDPVEKADLTLLLGEQWRATIESRKESHSSTESTTSKGPILPLGRATPPDIPLRPDNLEFVRPGYGVKVGRAGSLSSRIAILHALANVEQWAIDTALDNMARFGYYTQATAGARDMQETAEKTGEQMEAQSQEEGNKEQQQRLQQGEQQEFTMPNRFFDDFMQMACDESKHFKWLVERLESQGAFYGQLPVHASIWDSCTDTARSALARMAVVHMTIESRGLDVNPATIARFDRSGDEDSAKMLQLIHEDEVTHVQIGHRWFCYLLQKHEGVGAKESTQQTKAFGAAMDIPNKEEGEEEEDLYEYRVQATPTAAIELIKTVEGSEQVSTTEASVAEEIVDPVEARRRKRFQEVVVQYFKGSLKPPFNTVDREKGGLTRGWYEPLVVVRERTGFKPAAAGRRLRTKEEKAEIAAAKAAKAAAAAAEAATDVLKAPPVAEISQHVQQSDDSLAA